MGSERPCLSRSGCCGGSTSPFSSKRRADLRYDCRRMSIVLWMFAAVLLPTAELAAAEPARAEYAVRWDPAEGGPADAGELLSFFGASEGGGRSYEVRYFDFPRPASAPPPSDA